MQIYEIIMRTKDIKINNQYLFNNEVVTVIKRIPGAEKKRTQNSYYLFGTIRKEKRFLLDNGVETKAKFLSPIINA